MLKQIKETIKNDGTILIIGNGGSLADASHFASELTASFSKNRSRKPIKCAVCNDPIFITACANDFGYEEIFVRWLEMFDPSTDLLIALSTSGTSENIVEALKYWQGNSILLTGRQDKLESAQIQITYEGDTKSIQEQTMKDLHFLANMLDNMERK
jgi:phosphoheptose isomerase